VQLPLGVSLVSTQVDRWPGCGVPRGSSVSCFLVFVPGKSTTTVNVVVLVTAAGELPCTATVTSEPGDANPGDDSAALLLKVVAPAAASAAVLNAKAPRSSTAKKPYVPKRRPRKKVERH
jgi:hypothetical protein